MNVLPRPAMGDLLDKLRTLIDPARVFTDFTHLDDLSWDALSEGRIHPLNRPPITLPLCTVQPCSTDEIRSIVQLANEERTPVVPYGGGSGLMGGALSVAPAIVLDLRLMAQVLEIDAEAQTARVQAGAVLENVEKRVNEDGFILGHDPWTLPVATIGGAISTNSVGYRAGMYGSMGEQVLGLEAVLPLGEVLRIRALPKTSVGLDLKRLLIGGEGCFGIVTEATIRIFPQPRRRALHTIVFPSFEHGFTAIQQISLHALKPALLDFGDDDAGHHGGAVLYLGFEGHEEIVDIQEKLALRVCTEHGGKQSSEEEAQVFWRARHDIARHFMRNRRQRRERGRDGVFRDWIHVALPASKVLAFRQAAFAVVKKRGVSLQETGLWIQPELLSMRLGVEDRGNHAAQLTLEECVFELLRLVQRMGGSMEYTHGVGIKLAPLMAEEHGYGLEVMRQIKAALDPNHIMNPGKMGL